VQCVWTRAPRCRGQEEQVEIKTKNLEPDHHTLVSSAESRRCQHGLQLAFPAKAMTASRPSSCCIVVCSVVVVVVVVVVFSLLETARRRAAERSGDTLQRRSVGGGVSDASEGAHCGCLGSCSQQLLIDGRRRAAVGEQHPKRKTKTSRGSGGWGAVDIGIDAARVGTCWMAAGMRRRLSPLFAGRRRAKRSAVCSCLHRESAPSESFQVL